MSAPDITPDLLPVSDDTLTFPVVTERPVATFPLFPIGDALITEIPGFDILPCGRCGARFDDAPPTTLRRARILSYLVVLAGEAGWLSHPDYGWCCPACTEALDQPEAEWEDGSAEALRSHLDLLAEYDRKATRIMAAFEGGTWEPSRYFYAEDPAPVGWAA